jgi:drug/metabolite transporter (DMT)-like permease
MHRFALLIGIALAVAVWYTVTRVATEGGIPYLALIFWQCLGGAVLLGTCLILRRRPLPLGRAYLRYYFLSGLFGVALPYTGLAYASPKVPVGVLSLGLTIEPGLTYLLALVFALETFGRIRFIGVILGVVGLMLIVLPEASLPSRAMVPWVVVGLSVPVSWSVWTICVAKTRPPAVGSLELACGMLVVATVLMLPAMLATGSAWWFTGAFWALDWTVLALVGFNAVVWVLGFECVRLGGAVFYSAWAFIGTPLIVAAGMILFDERHSLWIWSALALLLTSLYLVNRTMPPEEGTR